MLNAAQWFVAVRGRMSVEIGQSFVVVGLSGRWISGSECFLAWERRVFLFPVLACVAL